MTKWLQAITCALALLVCFALPAQAQDRHGRKYRHGRRVFVTRHWNSANPTPGIPRRVRRGRNLTPGIPRGPIVRRTTIRNPPIFRDNRRRVSERDVHDILDRERNRDRDLGRAMGRGAGVRMGRGHGRKP